MAKTKKVSKKKTSKKAVAAKQSTGGSAPAKQAKSKTTKTGLRTQDERRKQAREVIDIIAAQLPGKESKVQEHNERVTLKHPLLPKGIVASAFCRSNHVAVLLPALGGILGVKVKDRVHNPYIQFSHAEAKAKAKEWGTKIAKALKSASKANG